MSMHLTLFLSSEGDFVEVFPLARTDTYDLPIQVKAASCKTHEQVLFFLEELKSTPELTVNLSFYHTHNVHYKGHYNLGQAHECSLDNQIDFVRYKIGEAHHGVRSSRSFLCTLV